MDRLKMDKLESMSEIDLDLERIDSLNSLIEIYKSAINNYLTKITKDSTLQDQIKSEMTVNF